jgi:hypothetical protein
MDAQTRITTNSKGGGMSQRTVVILVVVLIILGALAYYFFVYDKDESDNDTTPTSNTCASNTTEAACISPCVWDGVMCTDPPKVLTPEEKIADVADLSARYVPSGYDATTKKWTDTDDAHAFNIDGTMTLSSDETHVIGDTLTKFTLPTSQLFDRRYTLFTVAKYSGDVKERIFTSSQGDWYSGHNDGKSGVAKHDDTMTEDIDHYGDEWVVSCDQRNLYRANGIRLSGLHHDQGLPENVGVNTKSGLESNFAIGEILVYSRELNLDEIQIIEKALLDKYVVPDKTYMRSALSNAYKNDLYDAEVDCGENSALTGLSIRKKENEEIYAHDYKCMFNMDDMNSAGYVRDNIEDAKSGVYMKDMSAHRMDCGFKGLQGYRFRPSSNDTQVSVRYMCSGGMVDENTCEDKTSDYRDVADIVAHVIECDDDQKVLTSVRFKTNPDDTTKGRYEYSCCKPKGI